MATFLFRGLGTVLAVNVSRIGNLLEIANRLINAFTGPLLGIYLLAMFNRRATSGATLLAGILGTLTSYVVAYHTSIGFMWPSTFGLAATLFAGCVFPLFSSTRPTEAALRLIRRAVVAEPDAAVIPS